MRAALLLVTLSTSAVALGQTAGPVPLAVEVGRTVERDVGLARGVMCDDPSLVRAEIRTASAERNVFVATGLAPGRTLCRAGTDPNLPFTVFDVTVVKARPAR